MEEIVMKKDLAAINRALADGHEVHIRKTPSGVKIVAEKKRSSVLVDERR